MRALVSDATGLVGKPLAQALMARGWDVVGVVPEDQKDAQTGFDLLGWPKKPMAFGKSLQDVQVVFAVDLLEGADLDAVQARVAGLIKAADKAGVGRIVLLSSAQVYGAESLQSGHLTENTPLNPPASGIGAVAQALEDTLRASRADIDCRVLRPLEVMTPQDSSLRARVQAVIDQGAAFSPLDRLHGIDIADLVAATVSAGVRNDIPNHAFNLAAPFAIAMGPVQDELRRVAKQLEDQFSTEVVIRPEYDTAAPILNTAKAEALLHVRATKPLWFNLSELAQVHIATARAEGRLEAIAYKMPYYIKAIEMGEKPLDGKVAVVTGVTSGIGKACAMQLSRLGARVVGIARSQDAGAALMAEMEDWSFCTPGQFIKADLSEMADVRRVAGLLSEQYDQIDLLINNAGAVFSKREETAEGNERTVALNLLSPFLLTTLLMPKLKAAGDARIINLSSEAHKQAQIDLGDFQSVLHYSELEVYGKAKSGLIAITYGLGEYLADTDLSVLVMSPGAVRTGIWTFGGDDDDENLGPNQKQARNAMRERMRAQLLSPEQSGGYVTNLAVDPKRAGLKGVYFDKNEEAESAEWTYDRDLALKLWDRCAELTGL